MFGRKGNKSQSVPMTRCINCFVNSAFHFKYSIHKFFASLVVFLIGEVFLPYGRRNFGLGKLTAFRQGQKNA